MSDPIRKELYLRQESQKPAREALANYGQEGLEIIENRFRAETSAELWRLLLSAAAYNTDNFNRLPEAHRSNFKSDIGTLWDTVAAFSDSADQLRYDLLSETAFVHLDAGQPLDDIARSRLIALAKRLLSIVRRRIEAVDDEKFRTQFSPTAAEIVLMDEMGKPSILSAPAAPPNGTHQGEGEKPKPDAIPDGPIDADGFRFAGVDVRFGRAGKQYRLVMALWDKKKKSPAAPQPVENVIAKVWGEDNNTTDAAFRKLCSDVRARFQSANCLLDVVHINGVVQLKAL